jgi:hypothetical protein
VNAPLEISLDNLQTQVFEEIHPGTVIVLAMGRGTGKTFIGIVMILVLALRYPGIHIGLLMPSLKQARAVFWPQLIAFFTSQSFKTIVKFNKTELTAEFSNGSRLTTWGAENAHSIRGQRFGAVIEDECDDIDPSTETAVVQPTFSRSGRNAIWVKTGTPRRGRYGILYRDFELGRKKFETESLRYRSFKFKSSESPQVDQAWLASIKAITDPAVYAREYECDFDSGEGLVYPFDEEFHIRTPPEGVVWSEILIGCDHGHQDPGVLLLIGVMGSGRDAVCWVLDEVYETERLENWWIDKARIWCSAYPNHGFYGDPSMPARIGAFKKFSGARIREVDNSIEDGVSAVADRLFIRELDDGSRSSRLYVHPRCVNTIREFGVYRRRRDPKNSEAYLESIEDRNNHAMDALRYPIFNRFGPSGPSARNFNRYDQR